MIDNEVNEKPKGIRMHRIKLTDYQLHAIENRLAATYSSVEDMLFNKYKSHDLESLNALDYDDIIDDIESWHLKITRDLEAK